jgi:hypothetical protein
MADVLEAVTAEEWEQRQNNGRPRMYYSAEAMQTKIDDYFDMLESTERQYIDKYGNPQVKRKPAYWTRLILHLGLTREGISPYVNGEYDDEYNRFSDILSRARQLCECDIAENALMGNYQEKTAGIIMSYHHAIAEKQEINHNFTGNLELNEADLDKKLQSLLQRYLPK